MAGAKVAVIGGSGFYQMDGLTEIDEVLLNTPFGATSDAIITGSLDGQRIAFLPRHGVGHRLAPSELPQRANIWALKSLGVEHIIAISAVGSLRAEIAPLDLVVPDQIIDRTRGRASSFFDGGIVAHIAFADPFCPALARVVGDCAEAAGPRIHRGGTLVVMEGPAFSTRAESQLYRNWGASVIGMTALPEAKLAREAEICYATIACATDYDVWHESEEDVSTELVVQNLLRNVDVSKQIVRDVVGRLPARNACPCANALSGAIITAPERIGDHQRRDLAPIIGRYLPFETPTI
jgi:5'-methylthioadenosine phosphorylase